MPGMTEATDYDTAACIYCGLKITHGGTPALARTTVWFDEWNDFQCPDGEHGHQPALPLCSCTPGDPAAGARGSNGPNPECPIDGDLDAVCVLSYCDDPYHATAGGLDLCIYHFDQIKDVAPCPSSSS